MKLRVFDVWLEDILLFVVGVVGSRVVGWLAGGRLTMLGSAESKDPVYGGFLLLAALAATLAGIDVWTEVPAEQPTRFRHAAGPATCVAAMILFLLSFDQLGVKKYGHWFVLGVYATCRIVAGVRRELVGKSLLSRTARRILVMPGQLLSEALFAGSVQEWWEICPREIALLLTLGSGPLMYLICVAGPRMISDENERPLWVWAIRCGLYITGILTGVYIFCLV